MSRIVNRVLLIGLLAGFAGQMALAQGTETPTRSDIPGISNLAQVGTTVACAGAIDAAAVPAIKRMGFVAIFNFREATENGADIEGERAAVERAGLRYFHLPLNGASPDPAIADRFVKAIAEPGNEPAFIHCSSGNRAAAMWMIKRLVVDRWSVERASTEAAGLGLRSGALRQFAIDYARKYDENVKKG